MIINKNYEAQLPKHFKHKTLLIHNFIERT